MCPSRSRQGHAELALCSVALRRIQGEMRAGPLLPRVPFSPAFTSVWGRNGGHSSNCPFPLLRVFAATRAPQPRLRFLRKALARPASFTRRASRCERGRQIGVFRQNLFFFFPPVAALKEWGQGFCPSPSVLVAAASCSAAPSRFGLSVCFAARRILTASPIWSSTQSGERSSTPFLTSGKNIPGAAGRAGGVGLSSDVAGQRSP